MPPGFYNVGDVEKRLTAGFYNDGGVEKRILSGWQNVGGVAKLLFSSFQDFNLHADNDRPIGLAYFNGNFYCLDAGGKVFIYSSSGEYISQLNVALPSNAFSIFVEGAFMYIGTANRLNKFSLNGVLDSDFNIASVSPGGMVIINNKFYIADQSSGNMYVYEQDGTRVLADEFSLTPFRRATSLGVYNNRIFIGTSGGTGEIFESDLLGNLINTLIISVNGILGRNASLTIAEGYIFHVAGYILSRGDTVRAYDLDGNHIGGD